MASRRLTGTVAAGALLLALTPMSAGADEGAQGADPAELGPVSRHVVASSDGTPIVANLFLPEGVSAEEPAELVLETHGWGGTGRTSPGGMTGELVDDGYAVLTWDQRGFGCSGGLVHINDPDIEGRDVAALIDFADDTGLITQRDGDPVVGMIGGSYSGAIQTAAAAVDDRIDAIAPDMSWSDLTYSLYPGEVVKQGWVTFLYGLGTATAEGEGLDPSCDGGPKPGAGLSPLIHRGVTEFVATGKVSDEVLSFFEASSLAHYGTDRPVAVPTLVTQSAIDTLFNLTDGLGVYEHVRDQGVDARLLVYCGGHVNCPTTYEDGDDTRHLRDAIHDWFAEHLRGEERDHGAAVEYRTNEGEWRSLDEVPTADDAALTLSAAAENLVVAPLLDVPDLETTIAESQSGGGSLQATPLTAAAVSNEADPRAATFEVAHAADGPLELVGVPEVELTVDGTLLETLGELPADVLQDVLEELSLEGLEPVTDETGEVIGAVPVAGNIADGVTSGLLGPRADEVVPTDVHVFVKFVHREAGEVVNLQEGAVRIGVADGPTTVEVTMPGLAYTIPEGDHLDLQISTASLVHATGRFPAIVDAAVDATVPVVGTAEEPTDRERPGPPQERPGPPEERPGPPQDRPGAGEARTGDGRASPAGGSAGGTVAEAGSPADLLDARAAGTAAGPQGPGVAVLAVLLGVLTAAVVTRSLRRAQRSRS